jgi:hypothetical protein
MQPSGIGRHVLGALALAVAIYVAAFAFDQHLRTRRGPWQVTFVAETSGDTAIIVNQPRLNISNLKIVFAGERMTKPAVTVAFDVPQRRVPLGRVKFEDLTYLPGTVTLEMFGHEIELLPRTLYINRKARAWKSGETIALSAADRPGALPEPLPKQKY